MSLQEVPTKDLLAEVKRRCSAVFMVLLDEAEAARVAKRAGVDPIRLVVKSGPETDEALGAAVGACCLSVFAGDPRFPLRAAKDFNA